MKRDHDLEGALVQLGEGGWRLEPAVDRGGRAEPRVDRERERAVEARREPAVAGGLGQLGEADLGADRDRVATPVTAAKALATARSAAIATWYSRADGRSCGDGELSTRRGWNMRPASTAVRAGC